MTEVIGLLINTFELANGMLESKCYIAKRYISKMNYQEANNLLEVIEKRVNDSSKSNILIRTLNVIKASCLLIEVLERIRGRFGFLDRRVYEVKEKIVRICKEYM